MEPDEFRELHATTGKIAEDPEERGGGLRLLGIPTVADRIAQTVVRGLLEPSLEADLSQGQLLAAGLGNQRWKGHVLGT